MKVDGQCHRGAIAYEAEVEASTVNVSVSRTRPWQPA